MRAKLRLLAAVLSLLVPLGAAGATHDGECAYRILRDGAEIGYHKVILAQKKGHQEVDVTAEIEIKLAFLTLYGFEHKRSEIWADGVLLDLAGKTDEDGPTLDIRIEPSGEGCTRKFKGRVDHLERDRLLLAYWDRRIADLR